jgi:hypothetical protein
MCPLIECFGRCRINLHDTYCRLDCPFALIVSFLLKPAPESLENLTWLVLALRHRYQLTEIQSTFCRRNRTYAET